MVAAGSDHTEMVERMVAGGHILMIRHALAPGTGDPANFARAFRRWTGQSPGSYRQ